MAEPTIRIPLGGKRGGEMIVDAIDSDLAAVNWTHMQGGYAIRSGRRIGYFYAHRVIAERMIGRPLAEGEVVHHKDHNPANNHPDNLELFSSQKEHIAAHPEIARRMRERGRGRTRC